ncbi:MAG: hypothetical protein ACJ8C4_08995 [Gemmataceae bacterium]
MSPTPVTPPEYEFNIHQADLIGALSYRMSGVGFVFMLLGVLQIAYGIALYMAPRDPAAIERAAAKLGVPVEKLQEQLQEQMRPATILATTLTVCIVGLFYFLIGSWTRQAARSFSGIVHTRGQDVTRLMEALRSLRKVYGLIYNVMLLAIVIFFVSIGSAIYHHFAR